jgi:hypothetical protein
MLAGPPDHFNFLKNIYFLSEKVCPYAIVTQASSSKCSPQVKIVDEMQGCTGTSFGWDNGRERQRSRIL